MTVGPPIRTRTPDDACDKGAPAEPSQVCAVRPSASNGCTTVAGQRQCRTDISRH